VIITDYHACLLEVFAIISGGSTKTYKSLDIYLIIIDSYLLLSFAFFRRQKANPKKPNAVTLFPPIRILDFFTCIDRMRGLHLNWTQGRESHCHV
jgi:hypothetical protein